MTDRTLLVLLDGDDVGRVTIDRNGRLAFRYEDAWRQQDGSYPLSLSLPLAVRDHGHDAIDAYLWGLLPDNEIVLERWGRTFGVSARNAFGLLAHVGADCAGAVQLVQPERIALLTATAPLDVAWLTDTDIAHRLEALREDVSLWRSPDDRGQFSLAGAQPKTALLHDPKLGRWGVPSGRTPTTHILKPATGNFDGHVENEHMCLALARLLGLPAASSEVRRFENEITIVVERYDRLWDEATDKITRVHQEDMCQAIGVRPTLKYQNEGGPGPREIAALLETHSDRPDTDVDTFVDALALNWLIAGTDAHAKNYSILHGAGRLVRLAPLYDVASALPYERLVRPKLKLAMKVGTTYRVRDVSRRQWERTADELSLQRDRVIERVRNMIGRMPDAAAEVREACIGAGLTHRMIDRLATELTAHARECSSTF